MAIVLTAKAGRIAYGDHIETWYNLDMSKVIERSDKMIGLSDLYWIRDDGVQIQQGTDLFGRGYHLGYS